MYINGECMAKFETLLDHNVTPYEFRKISGFEWSERFVYLDVVKRASKYGDLIDIALLYLSRNKKKKATGPLLQKRPNPSFCVTPKGWQSKQQMPFFLLIFWAFIKSGLTL